MNEESHFLLGGLVANAYCMLILNRPFSEDWFLFLYSVQACYSSLFTAESK